MPNIDADSLNNPAVNFENRNTDPAAPGAGRAKLYVKDGAVYVRLDTGDPTSVGGAVALAQGRLAIGSAGGVLSALALGTEGYLVTADASGYATWAEAPASSGGDVTKIDTHVVASNGGAGEASFTWSTIAGTYQHLHIVGSWRNVTAGTPAFLEMRVNGDTGNNYDATTIDHYGTSNTNTQNNGTDWFKRICIAANNTYDTWSTVTIDIPNYKDTDKRKVVQALFSRLDDADVGHYYLGHYAGLWKSTSAITSLTLAATGCNLAPGSTFTLYGFA